MSDAAVRRLQRLARRLLELGVWLSEGRGALPEMADACRDAYYSALHLLAATGGEGACAVQGWRRRSFRPDALPRVAERLLVEGQEATSLLPESPEAQDLIGALERLRDAAAARAGAVR